MEHWGTGTSIHGLGRSALSARPFPVPSQGPPVILRVQFGEDDSWVAVRSPILECWGGTLG